MTLEVPIFLGKLPHMQSGTLSKLPDPLHAAVNQSRPVILVVPCKIKQFALKSRAELTSNEPWVSIVEFIN